jgi:hypothetical protein
MSKPRIAWFCPDPRLVKAAGYPVAHYFSEQIITHLKSAYEIEIFSNGFGSEAFESLGVPVSNYLRAFEVHQKNPFDLFFYQIENSRASDFIRIHMALEPGVTLFHDFILSDFGPEPILNSPWRDVCARFNHKQSEQAELAWEANDKKHEPAGPIAYREAAMSWVSIFSNPNFVGDYGREIRQKLAEPSVYALPMPVSICAKQAAVVNFELNEQQKLTVLFCGAPRGEYRAPALLAALAKKSIKSKLIWLLDSHELQQAQDLASEFAALEIEFVEGRTPARWNELVQQRGAVCVHTLFSFYCNASPYLEISIAAGRPCIVTDFGFSDSLPETVVYKIGMGASEVRELEAVLQTIAKNLSVLGASSAAANFAAEEFASEKVADELNRIFVHELPRLRLLSERWKNLQANARAQLYRQAEAQLLGDDEILKSLATDYAQDVFNHKTLSATMTGGGK